MANKNKTILIVEDDGVSAANLQDVLTRFGYTVMEPVASGEEAITAAAEHEPDMILIDIKPAGEMNGITAAERIRAAMDVPVVFLTAYSDDDLIMQARTAAEPYGYLLKPLIERELMATIEMALHRHTLDRRLKESEEKYRTLFDSSRDAIMTLEPPAWNFTACNNATVEMFRTRTENKFTAMAPWELSPERQPDGKASADKAREMIETAMREGTHFFEWTHKRVCGEEFPATVLLSKVELEGKVFLQATVRDITEQKRLGESLAQSVNRWNSCFDAIEDMIIIIDKDRRIVQANNAARLLFAEYGDISGEHCYKLFHGTTDRLKACPSCNVFETGIPVHHERQEKHLGDQWFDYYAYPIIGDEKKPVQVVHVVKNITARKKDEEALRHSEEQLRQAQKMEAVGRLAGGIAHDFNNMLSVINGYTGMIIETLKPGDPLLEDLKEVFNAGERSAGLTRQLLAFSRKQALSPEILDINKVAAGIEPMIRRLIGEDIGLVYCPAENLGKVKADSGQMEQVIMNLAVNSRDAMGKGGKLTIETENIELDDEYAALHPGATPGQYVLLSVADTGCGMDAETKEHIFEPFYTTKETGKGTGLGLSTVYGIVKQSGGNIWVYSEPGKGTTFKIYLPRELSEDEAPAHEKRHDKPTAGTETILVVEDEPGVRNLTRKILEASGYTVLTAANGGEAFLICERAGDSIQLMITDIVMPEMSGQELSERLAKICPHMKVLYMSGYTEDTIVHHGVVDKEVNFISKPFSVRALAEKAREVLDA